MPEPATPPVVVADETPASDARKSRGRREVESAGRRSAGPSPWKRGLRVFAKDAAIILGTIGAIVFSVNQVHPIFANQPTVAEKLMKTIPGAAVVVAPPPPAPKDTGNLGHLLNSSQFERDRQAFASDLVKTGRMTQARADSIAYYAVRESYINAIPPAVVFGVMLTENSRFISGAMSNVGAVGLMQVYPKVWLKALSSKFGKDLASDSTNLKYGIYILKSYIKSDSGKVTQGDVSKGLLHYNGCVHGTNTPNCKTYPGKVKGFVEKEAESLCGNKGFYDCIAKPFIAGLFGEKGPPK
jgi:hypothetical protein